MSTSAVDKLTRANVILVLETWARVQRDSTQFVCVCSDTIRAFQTIVRCEAWLDSPVDSNYLLVTYLAVASVLVRCGGVPSVEQIREMLSCGMTPMLLKYPDAAISHCAILFALRPLVKASTETIKASEALVSVMVMPTMSTLPVSECACFPLGIHHARAFDFIREIAVAVDGLWDPMMDVTEGTMLKIDHGERPTTPHAETPVFLDVVDTESRKIGTMFHPGGTFAEARVAAADDERTVTLPSSLAFTLEELLSSKNDTTLTVPANDVARFHAAMRAACLNPDVAVHENAMPALVAARLLHMMMVVDTALCAMLTPDDLLMKVRENPSFWVEWLRYYSPCNAGTGVPTADLYAYNKNAFAKAACRAIDEAQNITLSIRYSTFISTRADDNEPWWTMSSGIGNRDFLRRHNPSVQVRSIIDTGIFASKKLRAEDFQMGIEPGGINHGYQRDAPDWAAMLKFCGGGAASMPPPERFAADKSEDWDRDHLEPLLRVALLQLLKAENFGCDLLSAVYEVDPRDDRYQSNDYTLASDLRTAVLARETPNTPIQLARF